LADRARYWLALGQWRLRREKPEAALSALIRATRLDPNSIDAWSAILETLDRLPGGAVSLPGDATARQRVAQRLALLRELQTQVKLFEQTGGISRRLAIDLATTLQQLGRLWEAEAWASLASTLPPDDTVNVDQVRAAIVEQLDSETPFQVTEGFPELNLESPAE
jgi:cytochrome c-type biogenesis protein CcmH/NrfG